MEVKHKKKGKESIEAVAVMETVNLQILSRTSIPALRRAISIHILTINRCRVQAQFGISQALAILQLH